MRDIEDRIAGGLLGLAVGDALGVPVEFSTRADRDADPVSGMRGGGVWRQEPGTWSDDASLALCLAESIVERGFDPEDFGRRALAWLDGGLWSARGAAFDVGGATSRALGKIRAGMPAILAGGRGENDNGNGSLMRALPASAWLASLPEPARFRAVASYSAPTHGHPRSLLGCWLHCLVAARLLAGLAPAAAYAEAMAEARAALPLLPEAARREAGAYGRVLGGDLAGLPRRAVRGSGYVVHCLEASLWCLLSTGDFPSCVLAAVNLGEDADTTGAVAGGLAGLAYGRGAIPAEWVAAIARSGEIGDLGSRLGALAAREVPLEHAYWLLPGKLLAGPYPYAPEPEEGRARLSALLDAGIDAFVNLSEPGESLRGRAVLGYAEDLARIARSRGAGVEVRNYPTRDLGRPSAKELERALGDIDSLLASGKAVYLHCLGGVGRTGTLAGAWLVERGLAAPSEALGLIAALRSWPGAAASPETAEQRELVEARRPGPGALAI